MVLHVVFAYRGAQGREQSANYVRTELPVRIAHRLRDMQTLPYIVVTQEGLAKVYEVRAPFALSSNMYSHSPCSSIGRHLISEERRVDLWSAADRSTQIPSLPPSQYPSRK